MPEVARKDSTDLVFSPDGSGVCCSAPAVHSTDKGSSDVKVNGIGVVRIGDPMIPHQYPGPCCATHAPALSTASSTVRVNGRFLARKGDAYAGHVIITGSGNVNAG